MRLHFSVFGMKKKTENCNGNSSFFKTPHQALEKLIARFPERERVILNVMREIGSVHYGGYTSNR